MTTIAQEALDRRTIPALRLWGAALNAAEVEDHVIWAVIPVEMSRTAGIAIGDDAGLASYLIGAQGTHGAAVFVEQEDGTVEVGLRAAPGFDVSGLAQRLGGGGHALAAGCALPGPLSDAVALVLSAMRKELALQGEDYARRDSQR
jgi:phosphoesterase RecJ-like protein